MPFTIINNGRVVVVADRSLLEALQSSNGQRNLLLYGKPATNYTVESTESLFPSVWSNVLSVTVTNLPQLLPLQSNSVPAIFYRARE